MASRPNFTPNFPSYVSGHSSFGGAAFTTLADFYGTDNMTFTIDSQEVPGVSYTFNSFSAAAAQNAAEPDLSRHPLQFRRVERGHRR